MLEITNHQLNHWQQYYFNQPKAASMLSANPRSSLSPDHDKSRSRNRINPAYYFNPYGPTVPGGRLTSMSFGPVNGEGGERRLNVHFTRARVRCEVFASFDSGDIDPTRARGERPRILKRFLDFAKSGRIEDHSPTSECSDIPFEEDVADVVRSLVFHRKR